MLFLLMVLDELVEINLCQGVVRHILLKQKLFGIYSRMYSTQREITLIWNTDLPLSAVFTKGNIFRGFFIASWTEKAILK